MKIGAAIKHYRKEAGLTQHELAEKAGLNAGVISHYETGRRGVSREALEKISEALNIELSELHNYQLPEIGGTEMIEITKSEAEVLTDLIELYLFDIIRNDEDIDNINWLAHIISVYEKCKKGGAE